MVSVGMGCRLVSAPDRLVARLRFPYPVEQHARGRVCWSMGIARHFDPAHPFAGRTP
jgi:hypothetical protein